MKCWKCGKREAEVEVYEYPVCMKCKEEGIDPEEMEEMVIRSMEEGDIVPLDEIDE